jgi:phenylacetate-CoA ligase
MFVKMGALVRNYLPKPIFYHTSRFCGYLPKRIVWGETFAETYRFLKASESWTDNEINAYQLEQLQAIVDHAAKHVPYYTELFDDNGIVPEDLKSFEDFRKIPFLTKELIKENFEALVAKNTHLGDYIIDYTGGSTSEPMKFLVDFQMIPREMAFFRYVWEKFGYTFGEKYIELRGSKVAHPDKGVFWRYDPLLKRLQMDSDYLNDGRYIPHYLTEMKKFNSNYISGYPSSLYLLAKHLERSSLDDLPSVKLIMLASENMYDWQIDFIKKVFRCDDVFYHYGHSEKASLAVKCLHEDVLHFMPQYGYTEFIAENGGAARPGEVGEIVATSYNRSFPLIRYRTQDFGKVAAHGCDCVWGRYPSVSHIEGRVQEFIVTKDRRLISVTSLCAEGLEVLSDMLRIQYYQDTEGKLLLRVVPYAGQSVSAERLSTIREALERKLKYSVDIEVQVVPSIGSSPRGKRPLMEQKLDIERNILAGDAR